MRTRLAVTLFVVAGIGVAATARVVAGAVPLPAGRVAPQRDGGARHVDAATHVGGSASGIAVGAGRVWITRPLDGPGDVIRIDPGTGHAATVVVARAVPFGSFGVGAIAIGYGSQWTAANDSLTRIDPRTSHVDARLRIPRAQALAVGGGQVWVLAAPRSSSPTLFYPVEHTAALWEVDPGSDRIVARPVRLDGAQPIAVTAGAKSVWVADYGSDTVTRFDTDRHRVHGRTGAARCS